MENLLKNELVHKIWLKCQNILHEANEYKLIYKKTPCKLQGVQINL